MHSYLSRAGRWSLALALVAICACADEEPTAPGLEPTSRMARTAFGEVIMVTNTSGGYDVGGLPWAVSQVTGGETIRVDPGLAGDTITLQWTMETFAPVTIEGPADGGITISAQGLGRAFHLRQAGTLRNMTITRGHADRGSAVMANGPLVLEHVTVLANSGNRGAIHGEDVTLVNSTVSGNTSWDVASGIAYAASGRLTLINSTVARNQDAPGIGSFGTAGPTPAVTLQNSIIADNDAQNCKEAFGFRYEGMNISDDATCGVAAGIVVGDPLLGSLGDHGGPGMTLDLDRRSPAINALKSCAVTVDQRYVPRDGFCDIGAFEFTDFTVVTLTIDPDASVTRTDGSVVVAGTVTCSRNETERVGLEVELTQTRKGDQAPVQATGGSATDCTTTAQPWSAILVPSDGAFTNGSALATAGASDTPTWFMPATISGTVKLAWARR